MLSMPKYIINLDEFVNDLALKFNEWQNYDGDAMSPLIKTFTLNANESFEFTIDSENVVLSEIIVFYENNKNTSPTEFLKIKLNENLIQILRTDTNSYKIADGKNKLAKNDVFFGSTSEPVTLLFICKKLTEKQFITVNVKCVEGEEILLQKKLLFHKDSVIPFVSPEIEGYETTVKESIVELKEDVYYYEIIIPYTKLVNVGYIYSQCLRLNEKEEKTEVILRTTKKLVPYGAHAVVGEDKISKYILVSKKTIYVEVNEKSQNVFVQFYYKWSDE